MATMTRTQEKADRRYRNEFASLACSIRECAAAIRSGSAVAVGCHGIAPSAEKSALPWCVRVEADRKSIAASRTDNGIEQFRTKIDPKGDLAEDARLIADMQAKAWALRVPSIEEAQQMRFDQDELTEGLGRKECDEFWRRLYALEGEGTRLIGVAEAFGRVAA